MNTATIETNPATSELTADDMLDLLGIEAAEILTGSGGYAMGFWHNELRVDLEELSGGNLDKTFAVVKDIHDTAGMSFREYNGIDYIATLPDGVIGSGIANLCLGLWNRREELTAGFDTEWNGDWKAVWTVAEDNSVEDARRYWEDDFKIEVGDLSCIEVYDLSDSENNRYCYRDVVKAEIAKLSEVTKDTIQELLEETYPTENPDLKCINYSEAAEMMLEKWEGDNED